MVERFGGLDVVVTVHQDGGTTGLVLVFCEDNGMTGSLEDLRPEPASGELVGDELGAALHVGLVLGLGADAGDAEKGFEAFERLLAVGVDLGLGRHKVFPFR